MVEKTIRKETRGIVVHLQTIMKDQIGIKMKINIEGNESIDAEMSTAVMTIVINTTKTKDEQEEVVIDKDRQVGVGVIQENVIIQKIVLLFKLVKITPNMGKSLLHQIVVVQCKKRSPKIKLMVQ